MSITSERLKQLRTKKGYSTRDIATLCNISKSAVAMYETGERKPKYETLEAFADLYNVDIEYLLGKSDTKNSVANALGHDSLEAAILDKFGIHSVKKKSFPLLGNVACGEPIYADEEHGAFIDASADIDADFCLIARGDSMINARIFDGDLLFIKKAESVDNGEIAVVLIEDEATVKRVYYDKENNLLTLAPENPTHKPLRYEGAELDRIRILGRVVLGQYKVIN